MPPVIKTPYSTRELLHDLRPFMRPYFGRFLFATLLRALSDLAWLYPAYALASLVNFLTTYSPGVSLRPVWIIFILSAVAILMRYIGQYYAKMFAYAVSDRIAIDTEMAAMAHMFTLDTAWHEKENTGNKLKKIIRGGDSINRLLRIWINNMVEIAINLVGITFVVGKFDTTIALLTLVFLVTYYVIAFFFRKRAGGAAQVVNAKEEDVHGLLFESINNIRSVKVLAMAEALYGILKNETLDLYGKILKRIFWFQTGNSVRAIWAQSFQLCVMGFIVYGVLHGRYQIGFLILFNSYFGNILQSVAEFAQITEDYIVSRLGFGRMMEILREPTVTDSEEGKVSFPQDWKQISFRDVSFSYENNDVLKDISLTIGRGEKVGVVGLSGAGKSTLFKLLLKEHENYTGDIFVDDIALRDIGKKDYFKYAAAVLQDTEVFNFSLRDNIVLANIDVADNKELLERALAVSHVSDFLTKLPNGVETLIGEKGVKLSGGERQRVGLARAIFKAPQILLLDEATSHLDIESEEKIRASLREFFQTVTAVVIAHRLTTIREMDRIVVIEDGRIIEEGSFDELLSKKGRFFELWEKQKF